MTLGVTSGVNPSSSRSSAQPDVMSFTIVESASLLQALELHTPVSQSPIVGTSEVLVAPPCTRGKRGLRFKQEVPSVLALRDDNVSMHFVLMV